MSQLNNKKCFKLKIDDVCIHKLTHYLFATLLEDLTVPRLVFVVVAFLLIFTDADFLCDVFRCVFFCVTDFEEDFTEAEVDVDFDDDCFLL